MYLLPRGEAVARKRRASAARRISMTLSSDAKKLNWMALRRARVGHRVAQDRAAKRCSAAPLGRRRRRRTRAEQIGIAAERESNRSRSSGVTQQASAARRRPPRARRVVAARRGAQGEAAARAFTVAFRDGATSAESAARRPRRVGGGASARRRRDSRVLRCAATLTDALTRVATRRGGETTRDETAAAAAASTAQHTAARPENLRDDDRALTVRSRSDPIYKAEVIFLSSVLDGRGRVRTLDVRRMADAGGSLVAARTPRAPPRLRGEMRDAGDRTPPHRNAQRASACGGGRDHVFFVAGDEGVEPRLDGVARTPIVLSTGRACSASGRCAIWAQIHTLRACATSARRRSCARGLPAPHKYRRAAAQRERRCDCSAPAVAGTGTGPTLGLRRRWAIVGAGDGVPPIPTQPTRRGSGTQRRGRRPRRSRVGWGWQVVAAVEERLGADGPPPRLRIGRVRGRFAAGMGPAVPRAAAIAGGDRCFVIPLIAHVVLENGCAGRIGCSSRLIRGGARERAVVGVAAGALLLWCSARKRRA